MNFFHDLFASLLHPHFHYFSVLVQLVPRSCCASFITFIIIKVPEAHFYLILILVNGLVMALLLGIARFMFLVSWQRVGVQWGCVLGALLKHPCPFNERPTLSASQRSLCVWMYLMGGLVIFMRRHVCWLTTGGLCEALSLGKAVCCSASTSVSYSIWVQLGWGLGFGWGVTIVRFLSMLIAWLYK